MVEAKTIKLNGKNLNLKTINQLMALPLDQEGFECLGYYNLKGVKTYVFSNGKELKRFVDKEWSIAKTNKRELCGKKNRYKLFSGPEERQKYYDLYKATVERLSEEQLFY